MALLGTTMDELLTAGSCDSISLGFGAITRVALGMFSSSSEDNEESLLLSSSGWTVEFRSIYCRRTISLGSIDVMIIIPRQF